MSGCLGLREEEEWGVTARGDRVSFGEMGSDGSCGDRSENCRKSNSPEQLKMYRYFTDFFHLQLVYFVTQLRSNKENQNNNKEKKKNS